MTAVAALAAVGIAEIGPGVQFAVSGLLAAGAAGAAWCEALLIASLIASLLAGLVIALLAVHLAGQWRPAGIPFRIQR